MTWTLEQLATELNDDVDCLACREDSSMCYEHGVRHLGAIGNCGVPKLPEKGHYEPA